MQMSRADLRNFYQFIYANTAERLGIDNYQWKSTLELIDEIEIIDKVISKNIRNFIAAYERWYNVHVSIEQEGTSGNLTPEQNTSLLAAIEDRDATRQTLLGSLPPLP